jgi:hypothetical protein
MVALLEEPTANSNPAQTRVNVIALTIFISLALALLFVALFIGDRFSARSGSLEQDSLLPLDGDDEPAFARPLPTKDAD